MNQLVLATAFFASILLSMPSMAGKEGWYIVWSEETMRGQDGPFESLEKCERVRAKKYSRLSTARCVWKD